MLGRETELVLGLIAQARKKGKGGKGEGKAGGKRMANKPLPTRRSSRTGQKLYTPKEG